MSKIRGLNIQMVVIDEMTDFLRGYSDAALLRILTEWPNSRVRSEEVEWTERHVFGVDVGRLSVGPETTIMTGRIGPPLDSVPIHSITSAEIQAGSITNAKIAKIEANKMSVNLSLDQDGNILNLDGRTVLIYAKHREHHVDLNTGHVTAWCGAVVMPELIALTSAELTCRKCMR